MALASAGCEMSSSSYTAGPRPELPGLWAAKLASVASIYAGSAACMAGGTARPAAAEGEAGHEPGTGWPGPQVAALRARRARAWQAEQAERKVRPSQNSNLRAFVVEADRSPQPRVTCARINVGSELHYRNKFLR